MKGYNKEFMNKTSKMNIIIDVIALSVFIAIIAIVNGGVNHINSRFDTAIEEYTAKGYVVCDVKVKDGRYNNIAVKEDEIVYDVSSCFINE